MHTLALLLPFCSFSKALPYKKCMYYAAFGDADVRFRNLQMCEVRLNTVAQTGNANRFPVPFPDISIRHIQAALSNKSGTLTSHVRIQRNFPMHLMCVDAPTSAVRHPGPAYRITPAAVRQPQPCILQHTEHDITCSKYYL